MSNNYFKFKQFTIEQDGCAMKVGTDGCLLGGWFNCSGSKRILDIGCGTGLIAIMAAQRSNAEITGVEIDTMAAERARLNADKSPWGCRINIINADIVDFTTNERFDTIVSNPPYFVNSMKCGDSPRTLARHNDSLNCNSFFDKCTELLADCGCVSIVIPCDIKEQWEAAAILHGLCTTRITFIKTTPRKEPKRVMMEFCKKTIDSIERNTIVLEDEPGVYSDDAKKILGDFYLKIV